MKSITKSRYARYSSTVAVCADPSAAILGPHGDPADLVQVEDQQKAVHIGLTGQRRQVIAHCRSSIPFETISGILA
jgi:hypothetical protein